MTGRASALPRGTRSGEIRAKKLAAGQPITVVTMGDSLTDKRHWANREVCCWVDLLKSRAKAKTGSEVTIVNPAIGGTQLKQNLVLSPPMASWAPGPARPDLVTIFFGGGGDLDAGMTGGEFRRACVDAVHRVHNATGGSGILILTTNPSAARPGATAELAEACRQADRESIAILADTEAAFRLAGAKDFDQLFVDDRVHLSRKGHEVVAETVLKAIEAMRK